MKKKYPIIMEAMRYHGNGGIFFGHFGFCQDRKQTPENDRKLFCVTFITC